MVSWKSSCDRLFVFNASKAVSASDVAAVKTTIAVRRRALEMALAAGVGELQRIARESTARDEILDQQLAASGLRLAQARVDLDGI
jgi:DNA-binding helix-hairpin-helix protein with protein kinase domain